MSNFPTDRIAERRCGVDPCRCLPCPLLRSDGPPIRSAGCVTSPAFRLINPAKFSQGQPMPTIHDLDTPSILIDAARAEANIARAQAHADRNGLKLRPHIKTHKLPY